MSEPGSGATDAQKQQAELDQLAAQKAVQDAEKEARAKAGAAKALAVLSPKTELTEVQAALRNPSEAYLRYVFLDDGTGYAILIRKDRARVVQLSQNETQLAASVVQLRGSLEPRTLSGSTEEISCLAFAHSSPPQPLQGADGAAGGRSWRRRSG